MYKYAIGAIVALTAACAYGAGSTPNFRNYPVAHIYNGKHAKAKTDSDDDMNYRRALVHAARQPVNFAGHYVVFLYGCGSGCITGSILDVVTGDVVDSFPDVYVGDDYPNSFGAEYYANSRLLVIEGKSGRDTSASPPVRTNCYVLERDALKEVKCK